MTVFLDPAFDDVYRRFPLVLVDVGARGGLKKNWAAAAPHLRLVGFEPDSREYARLSASATSGRLLFPVALSDRPGTIRLHVTKDAGLSSVFVPNRVFLDAFPDADRFDIVHVAEVPADTLDHVLGSNGVADVDFIKADTQGSELLVLRGGAATLASATFGVEVEAEFAPVYQDQPLFADVDAFLRPLGYQLFDLRPVYWKRTAGRAVGGPRGQIAWADALYLRTVPAFEAALAPLGAEARRSKVLRALSVCLLYGYLDYALDLLQAFGGTLGPGEQQLIQDRLRAHQSSGVLDALPGRRIAANVLRRLWRACTPRDDSWSISRAEVGNRD